MNISWPLALYLSPIPSQLEPFLYTWLGRAVVKFRATTEKEEQRRETPVACVTLVVGNVEFVNHRNVIDFPLRPSFTAHGSQH